jgi:hypothetical protein
MSDDDQTEVRDAAPTEEAVVPIDSDGDSEWEAFDEEFEATPMQAVKGPDGLATLPDKTAPSEIPVLNKETMVCMADHSKFVIRNRWGEIIATFEPLEIDVAPNGGYRVDTKLAIERADEALKAAEGGRRVGETDPLLLGALASKFVRIDDGDSVSEGYGVQPPRHSDEWFEVEPIRPECRHYVRQLLPPNHIENAKLGEMHRACAARRDTAGAFMQLANTGMLSCSIRSPRAPESEAKLHEFDALKIRQGQEREHVNMFESVTTSIFDGPEQKGK